MPPAYTGTFAQHPISVNLIIFLNMLEEETPWKKSVWNLSVKRKLCYFSKTIPDLIASKMPGLKKKCLLFSHMLHRGKMCGINLFLSGSSSGQLMHICHNSTWGILKLVTLVTLCFSTTKLEPMTYKMHPR